MTNKLFCPHCGRCLGECVSSDDSAISKILISKPTRLRKKHFVHDMKCLKCKRQLYIVMEFID